MRICGVVPVLPSPEVQLGGVSCIYLVFLVNKIIHVQNGICASLKLFPGRSLMVEQIPGFRASVTAELSWTLKLKRRLVKEPWAGVSAPASSSLRV